MTDTLPLGTRVRVNRLLVRTHRPRLDPDARYQLGQVKAWSPAPVSHVLWGVRHLEGIVVGARTLSNGRTLWGGEDEGTTYESEERIPAYLVAWNVRREIVKVRPEDLEVLALPPEYVVERVEIDPRDVLL